MAGDTLIDAYLAELDVRLGRVPDRRSVLDEVADHLWEKVERLMAAGRPHHDAQRDALTEFGDPDLVGRAFASAAHGGASVPTKASHGFGWVATVGGAMWCLGGLALVIWWGINGDTEWWLFFSSFIAGFLGLLMLGAGVHVRMGSPLLGWVAVAFLAGPLVVMVGAAGLAVEAELWWFVTSTAVGVAVLVFGLGATKLWFVLGSLLALDAVAVYDVVAGAGESASFEVVAGLTVLLNGVALFFAGRWLATETPVDQPDDLATA